MMQGEQDPPRRRPAPEGNKACEVARERIERFLGDAHTLEEDRALREHLACCSSCTAHYREVLVAAARSARERRLRSPVGRPVPAAAPAPKKRRWRTAVLPVAVLLVLAQLLGIPSGARTVSAILLEGRGEAGGRELDPSRTPLELRRGDWVAAREGARVALESDDVLLELQESTRVLVEDPAKLWFRLDSGRLTVRGPCSIRGTFGVVEVDEGRASFEVAGGLAAAASESATLRAIDALGERIVSSGGRLELLRP